MNYTLKRTERIRPLTTNVKILETKNSEYIIFIITYLVPFFTMEADLNTIVAFIVLFGLIAYIYIHSSLFSINPTLKLIWGYNIYQGAIDGDNVTILTKKDLKFGFQDLKLISLSNEVYLGV